MINNFTNWITQVDRIPHLTQCPELQLAQAKAEAIVYKLIVGMSLSSMWEMDRKRLCQVFHPIAMMTHTATTTHLHSQAAYDTLQEYKSSQILSFRQQVMT